MRRRNASIGLKGFSGARTVQAFNNQYNHFVMIYPTSIVPPRQKVLLRAS